MKKYTDLSFVETAQAFEDGKYVERYRILDRTWAKTDNISVIRGERYRLVEEAEEWAAEVGEPVLVKTAGAPFKDYGCRYRGMFEGKYICRDSSGMLNGWDEIAPIKKEVKQLHGGLKEWKAKVGELVQVKHKDDGEWRPDAREYRGVVDGKYFCRLNSWARLMPWDEIAPVTKTKDLSSFVNGCFSGIEEKREPRVIYVPESGGGQLAGNHFFSPTGSSVKFVEEIEDEDI